MQRDTACSRVSLTTWFQYPLRVEVGCNSRVLQALRSGLEVSVPSTGRSGLQLHHFKHGWQPLRVSVPSTGRSGLQLYLYVEALLGALEVSVPSTGRSGLQLWSVCAKTGAVERFQYPLRVEVGCNLGVTTLQPLRLGVSVPSTGRSGLQQKHG